MSISEAIGRDDNENPHGKSNPAASAADRNVQGGAQTAGTGQQQIAKDLHADTGADRPDEKRGQHGSHEESLYHDDGLSAADAAR